MLDALKTMVSSKKWLAILLAIVLQTLAAYHVLSPDLVMWVTGLLGLGVVGQAVADHGKSAAQLNSSGISDALASAGTVFQTYLTQAQEHAKQMAALEAARLAEFAKARADAAPAPFMTATPAPPMPPIPTPPNPPQGA